MDWNVETERRTRMCAAYLATGLVLLALGAPAARAASDVKKIEQQYGVLGTGSEEGRRLKAQMDRVSRGITVAVNTQYPQRGFHLRSAKILGGRSAQGDRMVNAFALPDGRIYVTLGLLRAIQDSPRSDDELAFVVGHEVTHVVERHAASQRKKGLPADIAAILLGALTKNKAVGDLATAGASAYTSHYSREDEYRADRGGIKAMDGAGYDPEAAITMLERLQKLGGEQNKLINGWFGSHPLTENRIARIKQTIAELKAGSAIPSPDRSNEER